MKIKREKKNPQYNLQSLFIHNNIEHYKKFIYQQKEIKNKSLSLKYNFSTVLYYSFIMTSSNTVFNKFSSSTDLRKTTAPIGLGGLFGNESDNDDDNDVKYSKEFEQIYDIQDIVIGNIELKIRQFSWHEANANQVWPGTYRLAEYIDNNRDKYSVGKILELGAATGALSIYLSSAPRNFDMVTSDIDDGIYLLIIYYLIIMCYYHYH